MSRLMCTTRAFMHVVHQFQSFGGVQTFQQESFKGAEVKFITDEHVPQSLIPYLLVCPPSRIPQVIEEIGCPIGYSMIDCWIICLIPCFIIQKIGRFVVKKFDDSVVIRRVPRCKLCCFICLCILFSRYPSQSNKLKFGQ